MCSSVASESSAARWLWMGIAAGWGSTPPVSSPDRIPADSGVGVGWGWGQFSGQNLQGQRPREVRAVGDLGPLQFWFLRQVPSSDPLIAEAVAAVGRHTLRTADWGRFFAPQVSSLLP